MEYTLESPSPVTKIINVTVPAEEVNAALLSSAVLIKDNAQLDGFRKGKAPLNVIEKRFHDKIYSEARENLFNLHINEIRDKLGISPVGGIKIQDEEKSLKKDEPFCYTIQFEVMPEFELPVYEGLEVEEEKSSPDEKIIDDLIAKIQTQYSNLKVVDGSAPPKDGQIANIDFSSSYEGEELKDFAATAFNLELGNKQALPEFEDLVKSIPVGHTGEGKINFPEDFVAPQVAGKTINMKVTVNAVKERVLPELNDDFAKSLGQENLEGLRKTVTDNYVNTIRDINKSMAQRKLLDQLLKMVDFELPPTMVDIEARLLVADLADQLARHGKSLSSSGKTIEELLETAKPEAESRTRTQVLLQTIAKKEGLEVTPNEVAAKIYQECARSGEDFKTTFEHMRENGLIFKMQDGMLADKAMDLIYERAKVTLVDPPEKKPEDENNKETQETGEDKSA